MEACLLADGGREDEVAAAAPSFPVVEAPGDTPAAPASFVVAVGFSPAVFCADGGRAGSLLASLLLVD